MGGRTALCMEVLASRRTNGGGGSREIEGGILDAHSVIDETGDPCAVN